jgi:hypothetical protein
MTASTRATLASSSPVAVGPGRRLGGYVVRGVPVAGLVEGVNGRDVPGGLDLGRRRRIAHGGGIREDTRAKARRNLLCLVLGHRWNREEPPGRTIEGPKS